MKNHFLILSLNEEKYLKKTFLELKEAIKENELSDFKIVIIDDGSTDKTLEVANKIKLEIDNDVQIISNIKNIGPANSIKNYINKESSGKLFIISGDNDLDKEMLKNLIIGSKHADFVMSYYINREKKGWFRANISTLLNLFLCTLFNVYAFYIQGPCVWPIEVVKKFNLKANGIAYVLEANIKLLYSNLKFSEVSGYMNTASKNSTSLSLSNLIDILKTICLLFYEIKIKKKFTMKSERIKFI